MEVLIGFVVALAIADVIIAYEGIKCLVKMARCHKWYKIYGHKIGSDEFFNWCKVNNVEPSYFL